MSNPSPLDDAGTGAVELSGELDAVLRQMGAVVLAAETVASTLALVTALAAAAIPATMGAGVSLVDARGKRTLAASNPLVEQVDALQYEVDDGPCLAAWRGQTSVRVDDLSVEGRWPLWSAKAAGLGVRSVLSVPLVASGTSVGAMKVYSAQPGVYDERAQYLLELFAQQAAVLLANAQTLADARTLSSQFRAALTNRDIIGQAKGILIAQGAPDEHAAFAMLASASQRSNAKVHDVARQLVHSVSARQSEGHASPR